MIKAGTTCKIQGAQGRHGYNIKEDIEDTIFFSMS